MYKLCKTEQSAQRQRQLEDGLLEAMLQQRYEDISVSDLCDHLGVPRKSFYRYFASKDGALHALIDHRIMEFEMMSSHRSRRNGQSSLSLLSYYEFWYSQKNLLDALSRSDLGNVLVQRARVIAQGADMFEFTGVKAPRNLQDVGTLFITSGLITLVLQWHRDGFRESALEMADMTHYLLTRPLVPDVTIY